MTKIHSEWFSNPRPLPLDGAGKVDFSKEIHRVQSLGDDIINPVRGSYLISLDMHNRLSAPQVIFLPNWHSIIIAYAYSDSSSLSAYDSYHNIFRLDALGNVVWQVKRDEQHQTEWWAMAHRKAAQGNEEMQYQISKRTFAKLSMGFFKCGAYNELEETPVKYLSDNWKPDYVLLAWVYGRGVYELDIETGIAKNVTQLGGRDW